MSNVNMVMNSVLIVYDHLMVKVLVMIILKNIIKLTKGKRVKRCPRCKIYTEKNGGCNHMTCISCKYQWILVM